MKRRTRWILFSIVGLLVVLLAWLNISVEQGIQPPDGGDAASGLAWREVLSWDFAAGEHPDGWGWGEWRIVDGALELFDPTGEIAVYFTPVAHAPDFMMVTELMLVSDAAGGPVAAHLLTRDCRGMTHESGCVVRAGRDSMSVRHKVNMTEYLLDVVPTSVVLERGRWYRLRFTVARGEVSVHLDGRRIFVSGERYPQGLYTEPHVAAERGVVRFRKIQIFDAPRASGPAPAERSGTDEGPYES